MTDVRTPGPAVAIRRWLPDLAAGALVVMVGLAEVTRTHEIRSVPATASVILGTALAVGLSRFSPAGALVTVWAVAVIHLLTGEPIILTEFSLAAVAFGTARWGNASIVRASALSIPGGALLAILALATGRLQLGTGFSGYAALIAAYYQPGTRWQVAVAVIAMALLGVPWMAGLVLRISASAREEAVTASADLARVAQERTQAREIARMREEQARLARDVHDVVGHSLAVILAQAESGQYVSDENPAALKAVLATIATSARTSLRDIRQVLSVTREPGTARTDDLDTLINGLSEGGQQIVSTQLGTVVPLPPELAVTAFRVLQEMLTNAIKHGRRGEPIAVTRHWQEFLLIRVENAVEPDRTQPGIAGQGLDGMRQRLEAVGGSLSVDRSDSTFVATARIPVRAGS